MDWSSFRGHKLFGLSRRDSEPPVLIDEHLYRDREFQIDIEIYGVGDDLTNTRARIVCAATICGSVE